MSATLTVSGKICATGILDTLNSSGTANQVLTAGTGGGGLLWSNSGVGVASVTAGTGISVGGTLTNPSVAIADVGSAGTYAYPSSVTTNAQGQVTAITAGSNYPYIWQFTLNSVALPSGGYVGDYILTPTMSNNAVAMSGTVSGQTIPITGIYQINFVPFISAFCSPLYLSNFIYKLEMTCNGAGPVAISSITSDNTAYLDIYMPIMTVVASFNSGDFISVRAEYQDPPGSMTIDTNTYITYVLLSP